MSDSHAMPAYLYVGQSGSLRDRIAAHQDWRKRRDFPSLHYHVHKRSINDRFVLLAKVDEEIKTQISNSAMFLNLLEMWCVTLFGTLAVPNDYIARIYNPTGKRWGGLNVALPLDQDKSEFAKLNRMNAASLLEGSPDDLTRDWFMRSRNDIVKPQLLTEVVHRLANLRRPGKLAEVINLHFKLDTTEKQTKEVFVHTSDTIKTATTTVCTATTVSTSVTSQETTIPQLASGRKAGGDLHSIRSLVDTISSLSHEWLEFVDEQAEVMNSCLESTIQTTEVEKQDLIEEDPMARAKELEVLRHLVGKSLLQQTEKATLLTSLIKRRLAASATDMLDMLANAEKSSPSQTKPAKSPNEKPFNNRIIPSNSTIYIPAGMLASITDFSSSKQLSTVTPKTKNDSRPLFRFWEKVLPVSTMTYGSPNPIYGYTWRRKPKVKLPPRDAYPTSKYPIPQTAITSVASVPSEPISVPLLSSNDQVKSNFTDPSPAFGSFQNQSSTAAPLPNQAPSITIPSATFPAFGSINAQSKTMAFGSSNSKLNATAFGSSNIQSKQKPSVLSNQSSSSAFGGSSTWQPSTFSFGLSSPQPNTEADLSSLTALESIEEIVRKEKEQILQRAKNRQQFAFGSPKN
jgi:hypothetical protein